MAIHTYNKTGKITKNKGKGRWFCYCINIIFKHILLKEEETAYDSPEQRNIPGEYERGGSVFKAHKKAMKGVNAGLGLFFMGAFLAGSIAGLVWSINRTLEIIRDNEENMLGMGIGICVFFLLLAAVFGAALFFMTKDIRKTVDEWIRVAAKAGGLGA